MGRFSDKGGSAWAAPEISRAGMGEAVSSTPQLKKAEPNRETQAQEPVRKTEGGRYDDVDYSELRTAWEE